MILKYNLSNYANEEFSILFNLSQAFVNDLLFLTENDFQNYNDLLKRYIEFYQDNLRIAGIIK